MKINIRDIETWMLKRQLKPASMQMIRENILKIADGGGDFDDARLEEVMDEIFAEEYRQEHAGVFQEIPGTPVHLALSA